MSCDDLTLADMQDGEEDDRESGRAPANRMPAPKRSGTTWTEADYRAAGYGTIKLRLPLDVLALLDQYADEADVSRAEIVDALVRGGAPDVSRVEAAKNKRAR